MLGFVLNMKLPEVEGGVLRHQVDVSTAEDIYSLGNDLSFPQVGDISLHITLPKERGCKANNPYFPSSSSLAF